MQAEPLIVQQTATRYWVVLSGAVELAGAVTREAAESERELLRRLRDRSRRRSMRGGAGRTVTAARATARKRHADEPRS